MIQNRHALAGQGLRHLCKCQQGRKPVFIPHLTPAGVAQCFLVGEQKPVLLVLVIQGNVGQPFEAGQGLVINSTRCLGNALQHAGGHDGCANDWHKGVRLVQQIVCQQYAEHIPG